MGPFVWAHIATLLSCAGMQAAYCKHKTVRIPFKVIPSYLEQKAAVQMPVYLNVKSTKKVPLIEMSVNNARISGNLWGIK